MAQLSDSERQQLKRAIAEALTSDQPPAALDAFDLDSATKLFCQHWPMVKQVLQLVAGIVGGIFKDIIGRMIIVGDLIHGEVCKTSGGNG